MKAKTAEKIEPTEGEEAEPKKEKDEDEDEDDGELPAPQASPLRTKYKLWVDPVSKKTRKLFPCEHCNNLFYSLPRLIKHMPEHTGVFPFLCPLCPSSYRSQHMLTKHDKRRHKGTASIGFKGAQYQCQQCAVAYHTRNALQRHINNHSNDSRVPRANYVLKRKGNKRLVRTYPCPHCELEFQKYADFEGHLASHTGIKNYECRLCKRRFGNEAYLKRHMMRHKTEKSYVCTLCGGAFKTSSGLWIHKHSVHVDSEDYVACEVCGKTFKTKWSMKEHLRMAHTDYVLPHGQTSNWQCQYCGGYLPSELLFKIHEKHHVTDRPFKCRLCPATFKYTSARLSHERREHEGGVQDPRLVMPRTPTHPGQVKKPVERQEPKQAPVRNVDETSSSSQNMEGMYYPQHAPQHPLPPPQSFMQQHFQQLQQQQLQQLQQQQQQQQQPQQPQQQHNQPSPHQHSREPTPIRNLPSVPVVTSHQSMLSVMTSHYSNTPTPSHTPTPTDSYHRNSRAQTPNTFTHPEQSSTPVNLQPVYSSSHILPAAAAAASVLYDSSYYMAAAAGAHLAPPPPPPAHPTHQSPLPTSLPPHPMPPASPALSAPAQPAHQPPPPPAPAVAPAQQPAGDNARSTPQPLPPNLPSICSICNLTFDNQPLLWNHMAVVHNLM